MLKVADFYQKYETKNNDFYLGVAVSKLPSLNKKSFDIFNQLSLQDIPQTKIEVENNSKIWGLNKSKILLNEDANIINLRSYFKDVHPKIFSIGTLVGFGKQAQAREQLPSSSSYTAERLSDNTDDDDDDFVGT